MTRLDDEILSVLSEISGSMQPLYDAIEQLGPLIERLERSVTVKLDTIDQSVQSVESAIMTKD